MRTSLRQYLDDWFDAKKGETAPSTMTFYRTSLAQFLQFLGKRSNDPMTEVSKQDVVAFRNSLITQVSAKTANHDLKALKMPEETASSLKIRPNLLRLYGGKGDPRLNAHLRCRNFEVP